MLKKYKLIMLVLVISTCSLPNPNGNKTTINQEKVESFDDFYIKFYLDSSFQNERTLKPLEGIILSWVKDEIISETWDNKMIIITPKEVFRSIYTNLIVEIEKKDSLAIERYYINHSGFEIKRTFVLRHSKWYLIRYDISNI